MKKENLREAFELYLDENTWRTFGKIFGCNDLTAATDGNILIFMDRDKFPSKVDDTNSRLNVLKAVPEITKKELIIFEDIDFEEYKTLHKYGDNIEIECPECEGSGSVEWEYNDFTKHMDCPYCGGDGYEYTEEQEILEENVYFDDTCFKINNNNFLAKHLHILNETSILLDEPIYMLSDSPLSGLFQIGECKIVIANIDPEDLIIEYKNA